MDAGIRAREDRGERGLALREQRAARACGEGVDTNDTTDEAGSLGREMVDTVKGRSTGQPTRLRVGIVDVVPKLLVRRILKPALDLDARLVCAEDGLDALLHDLGRHALDVVVSDAPVPSGSSVRAFNHLLGESGVSFYAAPALAARFVDDFPRSLHGAPMLLPLESSSLRRSLNAFFDRLEIVPHVVAEFEDSALLKVFGADGVGLFPGSTSMADSIVQQYRVRRVGDAAEVRERFYLITAERRLKHPAVIALSDAARSGLFGSVERTATPPRSARSVGATSPRGRARKRRGRREPGLGSDD